MFLSDKLYNTLKFLALVLLPAVSALYFGLAQIWGLPNAEQVVGTVAVVETFLGLLLRSASKSWENSDVKYDGEFEEAEDGSRLELKSVNYAAIDPAAGKTELLFKVNR